MAARDSLEEKLPAEKKYICISLGSSSGERKNQEQLGLGEREENG